VKTIEASNLRKTYRGGVPALDGLSFRVEAGTIFGLLGPNGAGKSTTVKILTTLSRADSGEARAGGPRCRPRRRPNTPLDRESSARSLASAASAAFATRAFNAYQHSI
jgi:ABC-type multidrug transport system ATPase subunit